MDEQTTELAALAAVVAGAALLYSKTLGPTQQQLAEWVIQAFSVPSRWKGLLNLAVSVVLALMLTALLAWQTGDWQVMGLGLLAGIMASVEAAKAHDRDREESKPPTPPRIPADPSRGAR